MANTIPCLLIVHPKVQEEVVEQKEDSDDRREPGQAALFGSVKVKKVIQVGMNGYYKFAL